MARRRVYLDVCCLNRPADDLSIDRNRLESEAVIAVVAHAQQADWDIVSSSAVEYEIANGNDAMRRQAASKLASVAIVFVAVGEEHYHRAAELAKAGLQPLDALHVACAEAAGCEVVLSTDDRLVRRAARCGAALRVRVRNPLEWLLEQSE